MEILEGSVKVTLVMAFLEASNNGAEAGLSSSNRAAKNISYKLSYSTRLSSAILYLLIILRTGLSCILCTAGFLIAVYVVVTKSLYIKLAFAMSYKTIIRDDLFSIRARDSCNCTEWLWQPT